MLFGPAARDHMRPVFCIIIHLDDFLCDGCINEISHKIPKNSYVKFRQNPLTFCPVWVYNEYIKRAQENKTMIDKIVFFSEKQALDKVQELTKQGYKARWYKVKSTQKTRYYVEWK